MQKFVAVVVFLALAIPVTAADDDAAKKLNGSYQVVAVLVGGKPDDKKKQDLSEFTIKDGTISIKETERKKDVKLKFELDPTKKPAHIDITVGEGKEKLLGIYEVKETDKGTELSIAFPRGGDKDLRPKDFEGKGDDEMVLKLFRKKEK